MSTCPAQRPGKSYFRTQGSLFARSSPPGAPVRHRDGRNHIRPVATADRHKSRKPLRVLPDKATGDLPLGTVRTGPRPCVGNLNIILDDRGFA
jgi:hypothetical protein